MISKLACSVMCVLLLLFLMGGCNRTKPAFDPILKVQFSSEPTRYDPLFLEDGTSLRLAANTIATPYEYNGNGLLLKALVEETEVSSDQKTYTLHFRKNLKWSDGVDFHADQFLLALERLTNEPIKAALSALFPAIDFKSTKVIDATTIQVKLTQIDPQFLSWLTLPPFAPIRKDMIELYSKHPTPVMPTLAAYAVTQYKREEFLLLEKNKNFYDSKFVEIDRVKIVILRDEAPLLPSLKQGEVDILTRVPVLQVAEISKIAMLHEVPVEAVTYLGLNLKKLPFSDLKNRKRLRDVLNPKKFELAQLLRTGEKAGLFFAPGMLVSAKGGFQNLSIDQRLANPGLKFTAQSDVGSRNQTIMEWVQHEVKNELAWEMKIDLMEWKAHYKKIKTDPADVFRFGWQNPVSSSYVMYQVLQSKSINNFTGWKNREFDRLVDELRVEVNAEKRQKLTDKIEEILIEEVPVIPVLHQVLRFANSKRVVGFRANPFGVILFRELHLAINSK